MKHFLLKNMTSENGNEVPNQFIIKTNKGIYFQSYDTIIAFEDNNRKITLDRYSWDYSRTTGKYRNQFLGENIAETRQKIRSKIYKLKARNK